MIRLGVVSFLNSRPLIHGLDQNPDVKCLFDVPAALPEHLERGDVDAALIPVIDLLRRPGRYRVVSDACIGCDGETMTVRVFSQVPPDRIQTLWVDSASHTSVALARVLWRDLYGRDLELRTLTAGQAVDELESVLLIGDKVVNPRRGSFAYEVDLGGAWRQHTGLPFVFAVWAAPPTSDVDQLSTILEQARDAGVAAAATIAATDGPSLGWPVEAARRYLERCLRFKLDARYVAGVERYAELCTALDLAPLDARLDWPATLQPRAASVAP